MIEQIYPNAKTTAFNKAEPLKYDTKDLHVDSYTGYKAVSPSFYFGEEGIDNIETPYVTIVPGQKKTRLHIYIEDFLLFSWSISIYTKQAFDEYEDYDFTYAQWKEILETAKKLVSFKNFDDLFEYMKGFCIVEDRIFGEGKYNVMVSMLNLNGSIFWKEIERYKTQLNDMTIWSKHALSEEENMYIFGF